MPLERGRRSVQDGIPTQERGNEIGLEFRKVICDLILKEDARIAAVALSHDAVVWTCNRADYVRVPGLTVFDARTGLKVSSSSTEP
jgi:hypothetical protein